MDIALKAKRALAALSAGAIFASLFVFNTNNASADTFLDVTPDMWSYNYIEQGVDDGYFDAGVNFRPHDNIQRDEVAKTLSVLTNCEAGFTAPDTPTFKDVPKGWSYAHIECLAEKGIITGDTDPVTKLATGFYRPGNDVNRAEAVKLIVEALAVEMDLDPDSKFSDVANKADWFYNYVVTAYNQSVVDGYRDAQDNLTGMFGPADPITREQWAKILVTGQNPTPREEGPVECDPNDLDCEENPPVGESDGDLEVSLNADSPEGLTIPKKANGVEVFSFDVSAVEDDVFLQGVTVKRTGPGDKNDIAAAYLYEGDVRKTTERTISSDTQEISFTLKNFEVKKGETRTLTLVINISDTAVSNSQHAFSIVSEDKVTHNGVDTTGEFPVQGDTFEIGGVEVTDVTIEEGSAPSKAQLGGEDQKVASLKITAGVNDVELDRLALSNAGSHASEDLANCKLMRAADELAMTEAFEGDILTFALKTPFLIEEGQSRTFDVTCDIIGGRPGDDIILYLDGNADLKATDVDLDFGANVVNNFTQADANTVEIEGGVVTAIKEGPVAKDIAQNTTNNSILDYSVIAERDLTVRDTGIKLELKSTGGQVPTLPATGTGVVTLAGDTQEFCLSNAAAATFTEGDAFSVAASSGTVYAVISDPIAPGSCGGANALITTELPAGDTVALNAQVTEVDPFKFIENVKVIDADTKGTVIDPVTDATTGATFVNGGYFRTHPQDYELLAGKERNFSLVVDLDGNMPAGYQLRGLVYFAAENEVNSYIKDDEANKMVLSEDVVVSPVIGNYMFTAENTIGLGLANTPTSGNFVKGDPEVEGLGISITAGDAGDIRINSMKVRVYGCDDTDDLPNPNQTAGVQCFADKSGVETGSPTTWENALGNKAANTIVSTVKLMAGNTEIAKAVNIKLVNLGGGAGYDAGTDYYVAEFDGMDKVIKAGETATWTAVASSLNTDGVAHVAFDVNPADIDAEDAEDSNAITIAGTAVNAGVDKNPLITFGQTGDLTITSEGNPNAGILLFNATNQLVSRYKFDAQDEAYKVNTLTVMNDLAGPFDAPENSLAVKQIVLKYDGKTSQPQPLVGGKATFNNLGFTVEAGQSEFLEVLVNLNGTNVSNLTGTPLRVGIQNVGNSKDTFEAIGQGGQQALYTPTILNAEAPKDFVVRQVKPTFKQNSSPTQLTKGSEKELYDFDISVEGTGSVDLARMVFDVNIDDKSNVEVLELDNFRVRLGGDLVDTADINIQSGVNNIEADTGLGDGTYEVIVSFNQANPITQPTNVQLLANVVNLEDNDVVSVRLSTGDETNPLTGLNAGPNKNGNTGRLVDSSAGHGIFGDSAIYQQDATGFRHFIWSDSVAPHIFSTVDGESSYDFTNGARLRINTLNEVVQSE